MGLEQTVTFPEGAMPTWSAVRALLDKKRYAVQIRMIDGELSFPGEEPAATWREVRLGTSAGMVTLRREADHVACVVWGNADAALLQARNALLWAFAAAGEGRIDGTRNAEDFARMADMPEAFRAANDYSG